MREVVLRARVARATKGSEVLLRGWRGRRQQRKGGGWVGGVGEQWPAVRCAKAWRGLGTGWTWAHFEGCLLSR